MTRDRDNAAWNAAAQGGTGANAWAIAYSEFVLQDWRADLVRTVSAGGAMGGAMAAQIRYTAYGEPARFSIYDIAGGGSGLNAPDGNLDGEDYSAFLNAFGAEDALSDIVGADGNAPGDGSVDGNDFAAFMNAYGAGAGLVGPGVLSADGDAGLRRGYAGYEFDPVLGLACASIYHVRNRVYDAENGRWTKRDPLGYVDGPSLYEYCASRVMEARDASGLACTIAASCGLIGTSAPSSTFGLWSCVMCTYGCTETSRTDSLGGSGGCSDLQSTSSAWVKVVQQCGFWSAGPCPGTIKDVRVFIDRGPDRSCSAAACRTGCARAKAVQTQACSALPGPARALCKRVATAAELLCNDTCNSWCRNP